MQTLPRLLLAAAAAALAAALRSTGDSDHGRPGFHVDEVDGHLMVLRQDSEDLATYLEVGEPAKSVTLVGVGPDGMTVRGPDKDSILSYLYAKPGFHTEVVDIGDRKLLWVLAAGSEAHVEFLTTGEPAENVTRIGAGPDGITVRSDDGATIDAYLSA